MEATGEVDFAYTDTRVGRFRVNAFHQRGSYAAVLRIVASDIPTPEDLGVPEAVLGLTKKKRGLVLVTGPTGSGKSTTLASLIDVINKERNEHIITLEDPIEYLHKHNRSIVNQREIGLDTDSYGNALRAALREDPDIILVGEMRDFDTISTAITAAETGHLVFSTLHTIGAAPTIERIVDVFRISRIRSVPSWHRFWKLLFRSNFCRRSTENPVWRHLKSCSVPRRSKT
jgi:twitching motility protein PilT